MPIDLAMRISVGGMNMQVNRLSQLADNVAIGTTVDRESYDLGDDLTDMNISEHNFKANFRVFQVADEVMAQLINMKR